MLIFGNVRKNMENAKKRYEKALRDNQYTFNVGKADPGPLWDKDKG